MLRAGRPYDAVMEESDPTHALARALADVAGAPVELERPADARHGDYATNVALRLAGESRQPPREVAEELRGRIAALDGVAAVDVAGPGFLNVTVDDAWLGAGLATVLADGRRFGGGSADPRERIQVELVSANPTGPITVASARNGAYGDAVARLLEFAGNEVEREYYYNDAGSQMDLFRASVDAIRRGEEPPEDGYRGGYVAVLAEEPGDPVPRMLEQIEAALERFRIQFDSFERQSVVEAEIPAALAATRDVRGRRRGLGEDEPPRRRPGSRRRPLATARRPTSPRMPPTSAASSRAASTGSSTCSAPTTTATLPGSRRSRRCSGTRARPWRCSSTSSCT